MLSNEDLVREIEKFADRHGFSESGVSRVLAHNPNFLTRLRKGGRVYTCTVTRIRQIMREYDATLVGGRNGR